MKKHLLLIVSVLVSLSAQAQDEQLVINNTEPGRFAQLIGGEMYTATNIKVTGSINNADLKIIRQMAGFMPDIIPDDYWDGARQSTDIDDEDRVATSRASRRAFEHGQSECSLAVLDLSEVHLVTGGQPFYEDAALGTQFSIEKDGTCPKHFMDRCYNLVSLKLPNEFRTLPSWAVSNCEVLVDLTVGTGTRTLDDYAINNNWSLLHVTLPEGLTKVGDESIARNESLISLELPNTLTTVAKFAFCANSDLQSVTFGTGLKEVAYGMFKWCYSLESIDLSNSSVETIGSYAFSNCTGIKSVKFPSSLRTIGAYAFEVCSELESISIPEGLETVGNGAFMQCNLRTLSLPNSVKELGNSAFAFNKQLSKIELGTGVDWIPTMCFEFCNSLESLDLPDHITEIGPKAFMYCASLKTLNFPASLKWIDDQAFYGCEAIEEVDIPDQVEEIGESVFRGCSNLRKATLGKGLKELPKETFYSCYSLSELNLSEGMETLCRFAFDGCESLHTLILPSTVKVLENGLTFNYQSFLENIVCYATVPPVGNSSTAEPWYGCYDKARVYVPEESVEDYISAKIWAKFYDEDDFLTIAEWENTQAQGINATTRNTNNKITVYDLQGRQVNGQGKGLRIIKDAEGQVKKIMTR